MKINYITSLILALGISTIDSNNVQAQLNEGFHGIPLNSMTIGTTTYKIGALPNGWSQNNVDGLTPATSGSMVGSNAWVTTRSTIDGVLDTFALSQSIYTPAGTSNDYLISPQVTLPATGNSYLLWKALSVSTSKLEKYEVKISTTGTSVADFTNSIFITNAEGPTVWQKHAIDISAYNGKSIYIAIINQSTNKAYLFVDDIIIESINSVDAQMVSLNVQRFAATNNDIIISGVLKNNGLPITDLNIAWNDGSGAKSTTLSGLNIAPYDSYNFTHSIPFNKSNVDEYSLTVDITSVNSGVSESNTTNNSATAKISTIAQMPKKRVVIEEGTGSWCGWCPRGAVAMNGLEEDPSYKNDFIGIAVHNKDAMTNTAYDAAASFSGFPGCNVDRKQLGKSVSLSLMQGYVDGAKSNATPVSILASSSLNQTSRALSVKVMANFKTKFTADLRLAVVLVEDSVHNTASAYNQTNYYAKNAQGIMGGYESKANPVPAADMYYNHVGRELIGGYKGLAGSVPSTITDGAIAEHTFSYTVPATYNLKQLKVVALCVNGTTGEIYNAFELNADGSYTGIAESNIEDINMNIYPNPVSINGTFKVAFNLKENKNVLVSVYNSAGELVYSHNSQRVAGNQFSEINTTNWASGSYLVNLSYDKQTFVKNVAVIK